MAPRFWVSTEDWLLGLDSIPLMPSLGEASRNLESGRGCQLRNAKLAPRAGFEPATLRLTEATPMGYRVLLMTMKVMMVNDLQRPVKTRSPAVNLRHTPSFGGVTSQSMSHAAGEASPRVATQWGLRKLQSDGCGQRD